MEKIQDLLKLASSFSKNAIWNLYIVKWATRYTTLLEELNVFIQNINNAEFRSIVEDVALSYSEFLTAISPQSVNNKGYDVVDNDFINKFLGKLRKIIYHPYFEVENGLTEDEYLLQNYQEFTNLLTKIAKDVSEKIDEIANGTDEVSVYQYEEEEEEDEIKDIIEEHTRIPEGKKQEQQLQGEGLTLSRKYDSETVNSNLEKRRKQYGFLKKINHIEYTNHLASLMRTFHRYRNNEVVWQALLDSKRKRSRDWYIELERRAKDGDPKAIAFLEKKKNRQSRTDDEQTIIRQIINKYIKDNADSNPIIKAYIDLNIQSKAEKWKKRSVLEPEILIKIEELSKQKSSLFKYLKYKDPVISNMVKEIRSKHKQYEKKYKE